MLFYGGHSSLYYQHGRHVDEVIIIDSFSGTRQGDPPGGILVFLAHYQALKTIT
jgi:hypothetical protein